MEFPEDLKYSKEHEWVKMNGDIAIIGITAHAQDELGDVVYVEVPEVGSIVEVSDHQGRALIGSNKAEAVSDQAEKPAKKTKKKSD